MVNGKKQQTHSSKLSSQLDRDRSQPGENEEQPVKRSRVSRACDQCRASRERCDGAQPSCLTCDSQNRSCSYHEQPKKRGIQPNYIRTLELVLAWIFQTYPEVEARLTNSLPDSNDSARQLIGGKDAVSTENLHSAWRECLTNKQIEQMLSGSVMDLSGQTVGGSPPGIGNVIVPYNSSPLAAPSNGTMRKATHLAASDGTQSNRDISFREETFYKLPTDAWTLLEYYFAFTHSWLPMADKSGILKTMYSYPAEGLRRQELNTAEYAELWAIMALVSAQRNEETNQDSIMPARELAESLLPTGNASFELPHIRASIVLAMMDILNSQMLAAWLRIGGVVRLLYLFNLLKSLGQTTRWCRHIHLVAFVLESALGLHMQTPGHLTSDYIISIGFVDEDGMEEWTPWQDPLDASHHSKSPTRSFSTLNELVRTYIHLGKASGGGPDAGPTKSIAFDLIKNAASNSNRVQPAALLASRRTDIPDLSSHEQTFTNPAGVMPAVSNSSHGQAAEDPNLQQGHPFMTIPNEAAMYNVVTTPAMAMGPSELWDVDGSLDPALPPFSPEARMDGTSGDIFEELASLERQDSMQHPQ